MAKLIYLYIKNIDRKIIEQDINFTNNFKVSFNKSELTITKNIDNDMSNFFGKKIDNITLLIGKNGVGKTSVLDLLGLNEKTKKYNFENGKYFMIYHIHDDYYYFQGTMKKEISNLEKITRSKESFYFKSIESNKYIESGLSLTNKLNIYYSQNKIKYHWAGEKQVYKGNDNELLKYFEMKTNIEDALIAYAKFDLFENSNRAVRIKQKISYLNNPRYLSFLYEMDSVHLELESVNNLFLIDEGKVLNNRIYSRYTRSFQDKIFDKVNLKKEYFILRILEKIYLEKITELLSVEPIKKSGIYEYYKFGRDELGSSFKEKDRFIYNILNEIFKIRHSILQMKEENGVDDKQEIESKITFLKEVLLYLFKHFNANNYRVKNIDINNLVSELYSIPSNYFKDKNTIEIPSNNEYFAKEVSYMKDSFNEIFNFTFTNFSEGEFIYLNLFSSVYKYIQHSGKDDCILILDEPDINLHPEWSRRLIYDFIRLIEEHKAG